MLHKNGCKQRNIHSKEPQRIMSVIFSFSLFKVEIFILKNSGISSFFKVMCEYIPE